MPTDDTPNAVQAVLGILDDKRPIENVFRVDPPQWYSVGWEGITAIYVYRESGEMALVPWIAIEKHGSIVERFPARNAVVQYE